MLTILRIVLVSFIALAAGCTPRFLNPPMAKESILAKPAIVGSWRCDHAGEEEPVAFTAAEDPDLAAAELKGIYKLTVTFSPGKDAAAKPTSTGEFLAAFTDIAGHTIVTLTSDSRAIEKGAGKSGMLTTSTYIIARVSFTGPDSFTFEQLSDSWLDELLKKDDAALPHAHQDEGGLIITASTQQVRDFFTKHAGDADAWKPAVVWTRTPAK